MKGRLLELDNKCVNILVTLLLREDKIRFNELYHALNEMGLKMSKPTLSDHLKHLTGKGVVERKIEDVQNVSYRVSEDKLKGLESTVKYQKTITKLLDAKKEDFNSLPIIQQIHDISTMFAIRSLQLLKLQILTLLDPSKKLYIFSNMAGTIGSVLDFEYDAQLVFAEFVFEVSSAVIGGTLENNLSGKDTSISLIPQLFDQLSLSLEELAVNFEEGQDTYKALQRIVELAHTATERGYYLFTKGRS